MQYWYIGDLYKLFGVYKGKRKVNPRRSFMCIFKTAKWAVFVKSCQTLSVWKTPAYKGHMMLPSGGWKDKRQVVRFLYAAEHCHPNFTLLDHLKNQSSFLEEKRKSIMTMEKKKNFLYYYIGKMTKRGKMCKG